jgi:ATP-dependent DNA helicase RecG
VTVSQSSLNLVSELSQLLARLHSGADAASLETGTLEFKQECDSPKRTLEILADAVVCLANSEGGQIIVGVADRPGDAGSIVGVSSELSVDVVVRGIFDRTRPSLSVPAEEVVYEGRRLLVITAPRGAVFYANAKGTATRRVGTECQPFPPEQQRQALASRGLYDWSAESSGETESAVSPGELYRLRDVLHTAGKEEVAALDDSRLLRDLRLVTVAGDLTRAGMLLLGRQDAIRDTVPTYGYAYQYRRSPGSEAVSHFRETRPLLAAIERLLDTVEVRRTVHPINIRGGVQLQLYDYPTRSVRELVINAMVHRDYEAEGAVEVEHSPEQLVVSNPGGLVFGVTPQNILTHPSTPRNRLLLEVVTSLQVAERTGQGVDRVYREMLRAGKPPPNYRDDGSRVEVTVSGGTGDESFTRFVSTELDTALAVDLEVLLVLDHLRYRKTVTSDELAPRIQRVPVEAQAALERMAHAGLVEPIRRTARRPFPAYSLTPKAMSGLGRSITYHRPTASGIDRKVVEHVREYGFVTNQTLRRLFDLNVFPARDLLRDLQARGILRKLDDKTAGPGVRYGPGPEFPRAPRRTTQTPNDHQAE